MVDENFKHGLIGRKQSIEHVQKRMNSRRKNGSFKLSLKDISEVKKEYLFGNSIIDIASKFNCSEENIRTHLRKMNIDLGKGGVKKGNVPWNKGKKGLQVGWSKGTKGLIKSKRKGKKLEEIYDKKIAAKMKKQLLENRKNQIFPVNDTKIEVKIQNYLVKLGIEFYTHCWMNEIVHKYQCDIMIPEQTGIAQKTIIECFGDYWHKRPYGRKIDVNRCKELREKGWRVLVFWETEIKQMRLNNLKEKVI